MPSAGLVDRTFEMVGNICVEENVLQFVVSETELIKTVIQVGEKC